MTKNYKFNRPVSFLKKILVLGLVISSCSKNKTKIESTEARIKRAEATTKEVSQKLAKALADTKYLLENGNPAEKRKEIANSLKSLKSSFTRIEEVLNLNKEGEALVIAKVICTTFAYELMSTIIDALEKGNEIVAKQNIPPLERLLASLQV